SRDTNITALTSGFPYPVAVQHDGKILLAGDFGLVLGRIHSHLARLNLDGTLDATLKPAVNGATSCFALRPDGKVLVGGIFTLAEKQAHTNIVRLNADGIVDGSFNAVVKDNTAPDFSSVGCFAVQTSGKIVMGG